MRSSVLVGLVVVAAAFVGYLLGAGASTKRPDPAPAVNAAPQPKPAPAATGPTLAKVLNFPDQFAGQTVTISDVRVTGCARFDSDGYRYSIEEPSTGVVTPHEGSRIGSYQFTSGPGGPGAATIDALTRMRSTSARVTVAVRSDRDPHYVEPFYSARVDRIEWLDDSGAVVAHAP